MTDFITAETANHIEAFREAILARMVLCHTDLAREAHREAAEALYEIACITEGECKSEATPFAEGHAADASQEIWFREAVGILDALMDTSARNSGYGQITCLSVPASELEGLSVLLTDIAAATGISLQVVRIITASGKTHLQAISPDDFNV